MQLVAAKLLLVVTELLAAAIIEQVAAVATIIVIVEQLLAPPSLRLPTSLVLAWPKFNDITITISFFKTLLNMPKL
jgi:hypothetical protein